MTKGLVTNGGKTVYEKEIGSGVRWQPQNDQKETSVETQASLPFCISHF